MCITYRRCRYLLYLNNIKVVKVAFVVVSFITLCSLMFDLEHLGMTDQDALLRSDPFVREYLNDNTKQVMLVGKPDMIYLKAFTMARAKVRIFRGVSIYELTRRRYRLIVFTDVIYYVTLTTEQRSLVDKYCTDNNVGMIIFYHHSLPILRHRSPLDLPVQFYPLDNITHYEIVPGSKVLSLTRPGNFTEALPQNPDLAGMLFLDTDYTPIARSMVFTNTTTTSHVTVLEDLGHNDGIRKVIFSTKLDFWVHHMLYIDAISFLTDGEIALPQWRSLAYELDDVFRGNTEQRMNTADVTALIDLQKWVQSHLGSEFAFALGINGRNILGFCSQDVIATNLLIKNRDLFRWFDHTYSHMDISSAKYVHNATAIQEDIMWNREVARKHGIPLMPYYMITKAHSGIYPLNDQLITVYNAIGVNCTGSDRYRKENSRVGMRVAGFIRRNVTVLPRLEPVGLQSWMRVYEEYPGGKDTLSFRLQTELFLSGLYYPVATYFLHYRNFAGDRIGEFIVRNMINYLKRYTTLELTSEEPKNMATRYFNYFTEDKVPLWQNPCSDPPLQRLWGQTDIACDQYPRIFIVGPEHTGSTVVTWLLHIHPDTQSSLKGPGRPVHFFDEYYMLGTDWYARQFAQNNALLYDATPTYFHSPYAAERVSALDVNATVVITIFNPVHRAFSVYTEYASKYGLDGYSFYDVITSTEGAVPNVRSLRDLCLHPGAYVKYLDVWLENLERVFIIDGEKLYKIPGNVATGLQTMLGLNTIDFRSLIQVTKDGRICRADSIGGDSPKCIQTPPKDLDNAIDLKSRLFLQKYYSIFNKDLAALLRYKHIPMPEWLVRFIDVGYL